MLNDNKLRAIRVLAASGSIEQAARAAGRDRTTVWRWAKDPEFQDERQRQEAEIAGVARAAVLANVALAERNLQLLLSSRDERIRSTITKFVLETALKIERHLQHPERIVITAMAEDAELRLESETIRQIQASTDG